MPLEWLDALDVLELRADELIVEVTKVPDWVRDGVGCEAVYWAEAFARSVRRHREFLDRVMSWLRVWHGAEPPATEDCEGWHLLSHLVDGPVPSLDQIPERCGTLIAAIDLLLDESTRPDRTGSRIVVSLLELRQAVCVSCGVAEDLGYRLRSIAEQAEQFGEEMDFGFLYDKPRHLFAIGYRVDDNCRDNSYFDLLASEARLASFVAIARGQVPQEHWFRLGRALTSTSGGQALLSWTATMFEYLMPILVMKTYEHTLLDETYHSVVDRQIDYGRRHGIPWGVSESGYNARDLALNYQYRAFGVPGLGLKRGLGEDVVVSPYSTVLALAVAPDEAIKNIRLLSQQGFASRYGFFEAVDYTPARLPPGESRTVIRAHMAHHQGMSLLALDNVVNGLAMPRRFHADPLVQATELLLQERIPRDAPLAHPHAEEVAEGRIVRLAPAPFTRQFATAHTPAPQAHMMSNGDYTVMLTNAGGGFSRWRDMAVTRWREDAVRDDWGSFVYVRDIRSKRFWSAGYQPTLAEPTSYMATFSADKVEFLRRDDDIETHTEITVSPEDDAEIRRITLINRSEHGRELEVTSYNEVVLAAPRADLTHVAFSKLFVQSELLAQHSALLFGRRPRTVEEVTPWIVHVSAAHGEGWSEAEYETDRARFIGRGRTAVAPIALVNGAGLSGSVGAVLDPVACIRRRIRIEPGTSARVSFITAVAATREATVDLADKYRDPRAVTRAFALAWTQSRVELRHLEISTEEAHLFQELGSMALYADPLLRTDVATIARNVKYQSGLWAYGISGDLPILVLRVTDSLDGDLVRQVLRAHGYWRLTGLAVDLVILNEHLSSYAQGFQEYLLNLIQTSSSQGLIDRPGGVFLRRADLMPDEDRTLILTTARVVLSGQRGSLALQVHRRRPEVSLPRALHGGRLPKPSALREPEDRLKSDPGLLFENGFGGFSPDGREYVITLLDNMVTPAPWSNVVANDRFGFLVTESGGGYTWSENSRENRLTPWSNDPVSDALGEAVYMRDEETAEVWSVAPKPVRRSGRYVIRHGAGFTTFEHDEPGLAHELTLFVPVDDPIKILRLRVTNRSERPRQLSATGFFEWVLGVSRETSAPHIVTEVDAETGAMLARNAYNNEFAERIAFAGVTEPNHTLTASRSEFVGRNRNLQSPDALGRSALSGRVGAGLEPCAAFHVPFDLAPGETRELSFFIGEGDDIDHARALVTRYQTAGTVESTLDAVLTQWDALLGAVQVRTPDESMNLMLNRWLLYQTIACRLWGRSAFYQSGGAFGFRDQLQDVMALVHAAPDLARQQILLAAAHQFVEGDVQHWWHPPTGRGVRTRFSDDLHWLAFAATTYAEATGDHAVFDESVPFLQGRPLDAHEDEYYAMPDVSTEADSLYQHCVRALDRGLQVGVHGLPLMGSGDWNDGMNRVGHDGRGESVWMAWFLHLTLSRFAAIAETRLDHDRAITYRRHADLLRRSTEISAWDGEWYRRAYFDDGTPLGSTANDECRIDAIAQSWSVISGAARPERARKAMDSVERLLIDEESRLLLLFAPPFDRTALDPGYIKGYVPGVRENGGQYTHAAVWTVLARAMLGDGGRAVELFAMINPITRTSSERDAELYKVEPYVVAADVYGVAPHAGRGGWTWYTGSAGWLYQVGLHSLLGLVIRGSQLTVEPCIPAEWNGFSITYRYGQSCVEITVENPDHVQRGVRLVEIDGVNVEDRTVQLDSLGPFAAVRVVMGSR